MSSSRSIAAARNRRAGDPAPTSRPGMSQPTFSQQQQTPQNKKVVTAQNSTPNVQVTSNTKLTISDAIGLITLRLGRVEQIIMESEDNGGLNIGTNVPDNAHLVDKSVINSIVNRLDALEKKEKESSNNQQNNKLETEIRDIKDLLMSQMVKYEKFTLETDRRFSEVNDAFVELENQHELTDCCNTQTEEVINKSNVENVFTNLKNVIEQEFADSANL